MKLLYLCSKSYHETKTSRVRFDAIEALSRISDLTCSGNGFPGYESDLSVSENLVRIFPGSTPDFILLYKPNEFIGVPGIKVKKCICYNEMWDITETTREIVDNRIDLVVCHHKNDIPKYSHLRNVRLANLSHCANSEIYLDYGLPKSTDILFTGSVGSHYPFRLRLRNLVEQKLSSLCRCKILPHPGRDLRCLQGKIGIDYAKEINQAKITLTCSSRHKYRLGKYVEIPMCASLLAGDLPDDDPDFFRKFMLVLDDQASDQEIIEKILYFVRNDSERNQMIEIGLELNREYTHDKYARRLLNLLEESW